jgi:hypothetical protein
VLSTNSSTICFYNHEVASQHTTNNSLLQFHPSRNTRRTMKSCHSMTGMTSTNMHAQPRPCRLRRLRPTQWVLAFLSLVLPFVMRTVQQAYLLVGQGDDTTRDSMLLEAPWRMCWNLDSTSTTSSSSTPTKRTHHGTRSDTTTTTNHHLHQHQQQYHPESIDLAYQHSLGFWNDIPEFVWRAMRKKAMAIQQRQQHSFNTRFLRLGSSHPMTGFEFLNVLHPSLTCPQAQRVGGVIKRTDAAAQIKPGLLWDDYRWVCDPHRFLTQKQCLIVSVVVDGSGTFERHLADTLHPTCEIYLLHIETHMAHPLVPVTTTTQAPVVTTVNTTLGVSIYQSTFVYSSTSLSSVSLVKHLHNVLYEKHPDHTVDILNIECMECEWYVSQ